MQGINSSILLNLGLLNWIITMFSVSLIPSHASLIQSHSSLIPNYQGSMHSRYQNLKYEIAPSCFTFFILMMTRVECLYRLISGLYGS